MERSANSKGKEIKVVGQTSDREGQQRPAEDQEEKEREVQLHSWRSRKQLEGQQKKIK